MTYLQSWGIQRMQGHTAGYLQVCRNGDTHPGVGCAANTSHGLCGCDTGSQTENGTTCVPGECKPPYQWECDLPDVAQLVVSKMSPKVPTAWLVIACGPAPASRADVLPPRRDPA